MHNPTGIAAPCRPDGLEWHRCWQVSGSSSVPPEHDHRHSCEHKRNCSCCCSSPLPSTSEPVCVSCSCRCVSSSWGRSSGCLEHDDYMEGKKEFAQCWVLVAFRVKRLFSFLVLHCDRSPALRQMAEGKPCGSLCLLFKQRWGCELRSVCRINIWAAFIYKTMPPPLCRTLDGRPATPPVYNIQFWTFQF